jgi:hypothetical protein
MTSRSFGFAYLTLRRRLRVAFLRPVALRAAVRRPPLRVALRRLRGAVFAAAFFLLRLRRCLTTIPVARPMLSMQLTYKNAAQRKPSQYVRRNVLLAIPSSGTNREQ